MLRQQKNTIKINLAIMESSSYFYYGNPFDRNAKPVVPKGYDYNSYPQYSLFGPPPPVVLPKRVIQPVYLPRPVYQQRAVYYLHPVYYVPIYSPPNSPRSSDSSYGSMPNSPN